MFVKNKKFVANFLFIMALMFIFYHLITASARANPHIPDLQAGTAVLMEAETGEILYHQAKHRPMEPASTTKIMTALLFIENTAMREHVTVSENAYGTRGSSIYLEAGEVINAKDLLYGVMINSANDGAIAMAEHVAGSEERFAEIMNRKAVEIGTQNTYFSNPHGLPHDYHYTSAYDLAMITREALDHAIFRRVVNTSRTTIPWPTGQEEERQLINQNQLLYDYEGAIGVKTGYTSQAGHTFVAAAERDELHLIAVVLNTTHTRIYEDARMLLDYGFNNFEMAEIVQPEETIKITEVPNGREALKVETRDAIQYPVAKSGSRTWEKEKTLHDLEAPVKADTQIGTLELLFDGKSVEAIPLYAKNEVSQTFFSRLWVQIFTGGGLFLVVLLVWKKLSNHKLRKTNTKYIHSHWRHKSKGLKYRERRF